MITDPEIYLEVFCPYLWTEYYLSEFRWYMGHPLDTMEAIY